jgi:ATP-binding cassette subfamily C (CFTR/MRP) protein 4
MNDNNENNISYFYPRSIKGYLSDKICILVTHQIQFLQDATKVLVLDHVDITLGTYNELISSSFAHLLEDIHQQESFINIQKQQSIISSIYSEKDNEEELIPNVDTKQEGSIRWDVYISYIKSGLGCVFSFLFILLLLTAHQATALYSNWWLATWSDDESHRYRNLKNCSSITADNIRSMSENEWNLYRNGRFYKYCGELNDK